MKILYYILYLNITLIIIIMIPYYFQLNLGNLTLLVIDQ